MININILVLALERHSVDIGEACCYICMRYSLIISCYIKLPIDDVLVDIGYSYLILVVKFRLQLNATDSVWWDFTSCCCLHGAQLSVACSFVTVAHYSNLHLYIYFPVY